MVLVALFVQSNIAVAAEFRYKIDTKEGINEQKTTAVVDIDNQEIRLPKFMPNMADFLGDGLEYIVLTPDGVQKVNTDGSMTLVVPTTSLENPVAGIAGSSNYPDFVIAHGTEITHYSFTGEYVQNPVLSSQGYTNIMSVSTRDLDHAVLTNSEASYQAFTGSEMITAEPLSPSGFSNPIAVTLFKDHYGMAVLDGEEVKYYKNGSLTHTITGLTNALSISAADGGNLSVVTDNQVKHYNLMEDDSFAENSVLSITSELTSPTCIALRPGSYDRLVVDGEEIKYYMWTESSLVLNTTMSKTIEGLQDIGQYLPQASVETLLKNLDQEITHIKLTVNPGPIDTPDKTSVEWFISTDEENWTEVNLGEWVSVGAADKIRWKAALDTTDRTETPIIHPDIILQTNSKPEPPELNLPPMSGADRCYYSVSPKLKWQFKDPDPGDKQGGMQVKIYAGSTLIEDSGFILGETSEYIVDNNQSPDKLFNSGTNLFTAEVITYDEAGVASDPASEQFCVIAFGSSRLEIITPPGEDYLYKNSTLTELLTTRAGGLVTLFISSVGVNTTEFEFPYLSQQSIVVGDPEIEFSRGGNHQWKVSFYSDANPDICPDGTIIYGSFTGNGISNLMFLNDGPVSEEPADGNWWQWEGYRKWADGVVRVGESVFNRWSVILQGSEKD